MNTINSTEKTEKKSFLSNIWVVIFGALFCNFLWGSATPAIKTGYALFEIQSGDTPSILLFAGIRFFLAGIFTEILGSIVQKRILVPRSLAAVRKISILALFQTVLQYFFFYGGLAHASGVKSGIMLATNVFASLLIAALIFHQEKLTPAKIIGCVIGFSGVVLINVIGKSDTAGFAWNGEGFVALSSIAYGFSSCLIKIFSKDEDTVLLSGWQFVFGGAVLIIAGLALGGHLAAVTPYSALLMFYLVFISACAYTLYGLLLANNPVSRVVIFGFSNPIFSVLLSAIFLHEQSQTGLVTLISLILVSIGIFIVNKAGLKKN